MSNPEWAIGAGERVNLGTIVLGRGDIIAFATEFDAQPFHLDESAAETTLLGGLAASGWHTCTAVMSLLQRAASERGLALEPAGAEEILWLRPVRPDDALTATLVWGPRGCHACSERVGSFPIAIETINQGGDPVMRCRMDCLVRQAHVDAPLRVGDCPIRRARPARASRRAGDHGIKFFEDVAPGDEIDLGDYAFDRERIRSFRATYDGAPIAVSSRNEALTASVWHVTAAWMHCIVRYYAHHALQLSQRGRPVPILGPAAGVKHLRWHRPVGPGETISYRAWAERKIEIASHEDWGLLVVGAEGVNANGDPVVSFYPQMLLERAARARRKVG
ncbi:MAG: MaoC/PaaZ C-terminal domain-containing protein [Pseudomonadota bacterium]